MYLVREAISREYQDARRGVRSPGRGGGFPRLRGRGVVGAVRPPRYLLREHAINRILRTMAPGKFLEFGYGNGNMLSNLAAHGFHGDGYDFSTSARRVAERHLRRERVSGVRLLDAIDERETYDYVFVLEVLGYVPDILATLGALRRLLRPGGKLIMSVPRKGAAYSTTAMGVQRFFTRGEIAEAVDQVGFRLVEIRNYGFPLANLLSPFLMAGFILKTLELRGGVLYKPMDVRLTGLFHENLFMRALGLAVNRLTIRPFAALQTLFMDTNLGNGYIAVARVP